MTIDGTIAVLHVYDILRDSNQCRRRSTLYSTIYPPARLQMTLAEVRVATPARLHLCALLLPFRATNKGELWGLRKAKESVAKFICFIPYRARKECW